jgi:hypothetical protein
LGLGLAVLGCGVIPLGQGNPAEPILVSGRVLDSQGRAVGGARIDVQVNDYGAAINVGDGVPIVYVQSFKANPDGTFEIHLAPTPALVAFADRQGGAVTFNLYAYVGSSVAPSAFTRFVKGDAWVDEPVLSIDLRPIPGRPGIPTPMPGAT